MTQRLAVFDVDGTLFRSSLLIELVEELISSGIFAPKVREAYTEEYNYWVRREGDYTDYETKMVQVFLENVKGVHYGDVVDAAERVIEKKGKQMYRYTRDLIADLHRQDYYLVAISFSPKFVVDQFCSQLHFNKVYGSMYEIGPQDRFTGGMMDFHITANKGKLMKRVLEKEPVTTHGSIGVGDTESDIPFLELVDRPICFNPSSGLYQYAKTAGWDVVVERKDVIYTL